MHTEVNDILFLTETIFKRTAKQEDIYFSSAARRGRVDCLGEANKHTQKAIFTQYNHIGHELVSFQLQYNSWAGCLIFQNYYHLHSFRIIITASEGGFRMARVSRDKLPAHL